MAVTAITDYGVPYVRGVTGIDCTVIGNTQILVSESDSSVRHFILLMLLGAQTLTGVTAGPTISVGTNSPNFDNIVAATAVPTGATGNTFILPKNTDPVIQAGAAVTVRVSVAATATTYTIRAHVLVLSLTNAVT